MNKLEKLIASLCPRGVEYKTLGEVATDFYRGNGILRTQITDAGIPCVRYGEIYTSYNTWFDTCISHTRIEYIPSPKYFEHGDILFSITGEKISEIGKSTVYVGHDKCLAGGDIVVMKHNQNPKYMGYALSTNEAQQQKSKGKVKSKVVHLSVAELMAVVIPVPPLPVQEEIVRMLDEMAGLIDELEQELAARKQQYEWYRDSYFRCSKAKRIAIKDIGVLTRGKRFVHADAVESGVPCVHYGEIYTRYGVFADVAQSNIRRELGSKMRYAHKNDVIIVGAGENSDDIGIGVSWEGDCDVAVHDACYTLVHAQNPRYVSYFLRSKIYHSQIKRFVSEGKICSISAEGVGRALIPIPIRSEQDAVAKSFDDFELLCREVLPSEIALRKQQYEYYRDRLLTFKRVG
ncbi:MAG: restriction endonuclease subunit S [bacterium]|nr:restriction endonuclease subunit S [bacterium]